MSAKKSGRKSTAKSTSRSSAAKNANRSKSSSGKSAGDKERERDVRRSNRADAAVAGSGEGFNNTHGRYRDEVVEISDGGKFLVRRTFLASKTEFEVKVGELELGKSFAQMRQLAPDLREQLVRDAAKAGLDALSEQLSKNVDNSASGGEPKAKIPGSPNDRSSSAGTSKSEEEVAKATT